MESITLMVRNLHMEKVWPLTDMRSWRKITGPPSSRRMAMAMSSNSGEKPTSTTREMAISISRLRIRWPRVILPYSISRKGASSTTICRALESMMSCSAAWLITSLRWL